jgi:hypothetical protein
MSLKRRRWRLSWDAAALDWRPPHAQPEGCRRSFWRLARCPDLGVGWRYGQGTLDPNDCQRDVPALLLHLAHAAEKTAALRKGGASLSQGRFGRHQITPIEQQRRQAVMAIAVAWTSRDGA